jgi:hypothetical protein
MKPPSASAGSSSDAPTASGLNSSVPASVNSGRLAPKKPTPMYEVQ